MIFIHVGDWSRKNVLQNFYPANSSKPNAAYSFKKEGRNGKS